MNKPIKDILFSALTLTLICAIAVAALAATNLLTSDTIAVREQQATEEACRQVLKAESYTTLDIDLGEGFEGVVAVYEAKNGDNVCGYVVKTTTTGKASGLVLMTGIYADGTVSGITDVSNKETAGYMDDVKEKGLFGSLLGKSKDTVEVDGISQATKTSNGVKAGVRLALAVFEEVSDRG